MSKVLLFGGSFDPIHHGHLIVSRAAAEQLGVGRVVLIPSQIPPHKQDRDLAPAEERLAMCRSAVRDDPLFEVSDWELSQAGPSYTLRTVTHFGQAFGAGRDALCWLIGMDSLAELPTWHRVAELLERCTIVTAGRPGFEADVSALEQAFGVAAAVRLRQHIVDTPMIDISATTIRGRAGSGMSVRYFVPDVVAEHIERRGLYAK